MPSSSTTCEQVPTLLPSPDLKPVEIVVAWLIAGQRDADVRAGIAAAWPDLDATKLQRQAVEHFARAAECDISVVHGWALEAYRDLYRLSAAIADFPTAIRAVKELVALSNYVHRNREEDEEEDAEESSEGTVEGNAELPKQRGRAKERKAGS